MALNINIREVYRLGEPVSFWATIDPTDSPMSLPSSDPYQFHHDQKLIFQPRARGVSRRITQDHPGEWHWNQKDQFRQQVGEGKYELLFFAPDARVHPFEISASLSKVLKSSSKWCGRATKWGGLATAFFEPLTGAILAFVSVPFEWIEKDPPSNNFDKLEQIPKINDSLGSLYENTERYKVSEAVRLTTYLLVVHKTIEKIAGAQEAGEVKLAALQQSHLEFLTADISRATRSLSNELAKSKQGPTQINAKKAVEIIQDEIQKPFLKNLLNEYEMISHGFARHLDGILKEYRNVDFVYSSTLNNLKLELTRFSNSVDSPLDQAAA